MRAAPSLAVDEDKSFEIEYSEDAGRRMLFRFIGFDHALHALYLLENASQVVGIHFGECVSGQVNRDVKAGELLSKADFITLDKPQPICLILNQDYGI